MDSFSFLNARRSIDDATPEEWNRTSANVYRKRREQPEDAPVAGLGRKFDEDKPQYSLLPPGTLREVVEVLTYGARKYSPNNWKHVADAKSRYYDAAMRHIEAWMCGESADPETGKSHLAHAVCCLLFLLWFDKQNLLS